MTTEIQLRPGAFINSRALVLPETLTNDEWEGMARKISTIIDAGPFVIGDWLNYGKRKWGITLNAFLKSETGKIFAGLSGMGLDNLTIAMTTTERIPPEYRIEGTGITHHFIASKFALGEDKPLEQREDAYKQIKAWLETAKEKSLTAREFKMLINGRMTIQDANPSTQSETKQTGSTPSAPDKGTKTVTSRILDVHRTCGEILKEVTIASLTDYSPEHREALRIDLAPLMKDMTELTDIYLALCQE